MNEIVAVVVGVVEPLVGELIAAAIVSLLGLTWAWLRNWLRLATVRRAFGRNVHRHDAVFVSLPLWTLLEGSRDVPRFRRTFRDVDHDLYGPSEMYARDDIQGARQISDVFARIFREQVPFQPDVYSVDFEARTAILVGAYLANFDARTVRDQYERDWPDDLPLQFVDIEETPETGAAYVIRDKATGVVYASDEHFEYAYIMRVPNNLGTFRGAYIFFLAGIHAAGTEAASLYFAKHWKRFARRQGPAFVLLKLPRDAPNQHTVEVERGLERWWERLRAPTRTPPIKSPA